MAIPGKSPGLLKKIISILVNITCDGKPVSSLYGCVSDGVVCSEHGTCLNNQCNCESGYEGILCDRISTSSSSSDSSTIIGIVLGNDKLELTVLIFRLALLPTSHISTATTTCVSQVSSYQ